MCFYLENLEETKSSIKRPVLTYGTRLTCVLDMGLLPKKGYPIKDTRRTELQGNDWQAKEQISLTGELNYLY